VDSEEELIDHTFVTAMIKCDSASNNTKPPSPAPTKPGPATITDGHDLCPGRDDVSNFATTDAAKCNEACYGNDACGAYVLNSGKCFLKSCIGPMVPKVGGCSI
tara:strand:+ start:77 stop:388 length:312 start_codon:yes stop_codon:yes gene_type:complete